MDAGELIKVCDQLRARGVVRLRADDIPQKNAMAARIFIPAILLLQDTWCGGGREGVWPLYRRKLRVKLEFSNKLFNLAG